MSYEGYRELAHAFGLTMRPWDVPLTANEVRLDGVVLGQRVSLRRWIGKHPRVTFRAPLLPALDLGLVIRRAGVVASVQELLGAVDVEVGDAAFDASFAVRADEPDRARALLGGALRAELGVVADDPIEVRDDEVVLDLPLDTWRNVFRSPDRDVAWLVERTRRVASIAAAIDQARAATPPATHLTPLVPALAAVAHRRGLTLAADAPARVFGVIGGAEVWVATRRKARGASELEVAARIPTPVDVHLVVSTARTGVGTWLLGADVAVGDAAFDAAFDVRTDDRERLLALLDPPARAALVELGRGRRLELDRWGIRVVSEATEVDPTTLPLLVERLAELAVGLGRGAPAAGYR